MSLPPTSLFHRGPLPTSVDGEIVAWEVMSLPPSSLFQYGPPTSVDGEVVACEVMRLPEMIPDVRVEVAPRVALSVGHGARQVARVTRARIRLFALVLCSVTTT